MFMQRLVAIAALSIALALPVAAAEDAIGVPGPIVFEQTRFDLAWSSHPAPTYYKQEYLPAGQTVEAYGQMFMVELLTEGKSPRTAASDMMAALELRRSTDPVLNYAVIENSETGEVLLDFLLSGNKSPTLVVEWNAYRYVPHESGLMLYAISRRGYGDGATTFVKDLGDWRIKTIESLASMDVPKPTLN